MKLYDVKVKGTSIGTVMNVQAVSRKEAVSTALRLVEQGEVEWCKSKEEVLSVQEIYVKKQSK